MKYPSFFVVLFVLTLITQISYCQLFRSKLPIDISVSEGLITPGELNGWGEEPMSSFKSFPYKISGAAFVSIHKYISKGIAIGVSTGLDNQKGDLTYGKVDHSWGPYRGMPGESGVYTRKVYSFAAELKISHSSFVKGWNAMFANNIEIYSLVGAGVTSTSVDYKIFKNDDFEYFFKSSGGLSSNPLTLKTQKVAYQVTPFGVKIGKTYSFFCEGGYGYKGIFCAGLCLML